MKALVGIYCLLGGAFALYGLGVVVAYAILVPIAVGAAIGFVGKK